MKGFLALGAAIVLTLAAIVFFGIGFYLSPQSKLEHADAIVAISGGETDSRVSEAVKLYKDGWSHQLIFSGAARDTSGPSNASAMRREAVNLGVPTTDITIEEKSTSTKQNAEYVGSIIKERGYSSIILVTSPYHQRRANLAFHKSLGKGVRIINHSAVDKNWRRSRWWANPRSFALTVAELAKNLFVIVGGNPA